MANNVTMAQMDTHANWYLDLSRYKSATRHQHSKHHTMPHENYKDTDCRVLPTGKFNGTISELYCPADRKV